MNEGPVVLMTMVEINKDKRQRNRFEQQLLVRFGENRHDHTGVTFDLSPVGIFIRSSCLFPLRTHLDLELTLPDKQLIYCSGKVVWVKQLSVNSDQLFQTQGMGIHLTEIPDSYLLFASTGRC
ncbi:MAG: PilZ domain-containing protein [Nitrospiria bacterium]